MTCADAILNKVRHSRPEVMKLDFAVCVRYPKMASICRVVAVIEYGVAQGSWYH